MPVAAVAALAAAVWLGVAGAGSIAPPPDARPVMRFEHTLPGELGFRGGNRTQIAGSPDGTRFVYNTGDGLYLRTLSDGTDRRLVIGRVTSSPTFSPDGQSVAYFDAGQIKRLALTGGAPVVVATTVNPFGINWAADNAIYFASPDGIWRVPADGGDPEVVIAGAGGQQYSGAQLLPDGETVLFTVYGATVSPGQPNAMIAVQSTRGGQRRVVVQSGANGKYVDGHIVYTVNNALFAVPFDARALQATGGAISLTERVRVGIASAGVSTASFDVANNGTLFYLAGVDAAQNNQLVWVLRNGTAEPIKPIQKGGFGTYSTPQLSRDGRRVLVVADSDLRIYELATGRETRLTSDQSVGAFAAWLRRRTRGGVFCDSGRNRQHDAYLAATAGSHRRCRASHHARRTGSPRRRVTRWPHDAVSSSRAANHQRPFARHGHAPAEEHGASSLRRGYRGRQRVPCSHPMAGSSPISMACPAWASW